jgi:hypothetical protein
MPAGLRVKNTGVVGVVFGAGLALRGSGAAHLLRTGNANESASASPRPGDGRLRFFMSFFASSWILPSMRGTVSG